MSTFVVQTALDLGFARAGVTGIDTPARYSQYREWLDRGDHASMSYMADDFHLQARRDLRALLPDAKSAIVVALSYPKRSPPARDLSNEGDVGDESDPRGTVAQYALGDDYHQVIKEKLATLAQHLETRAGASLTFRACVDSAPLLERELAERAGLGFVAKNTMLISPGLGSYTLLGVLLTSARLRPTPAQGTRDCGSCTACLDACPTHAFRGPYQLDARRCISFLTIESEEAIPAELRPLVGDRIFGCDECQDVCPYNRQAPLRAQLSPQLMPRDDSRARPSLAALAALGSNQRKRYVHKSPLRRNRREQMLRNIAVALGNSQPDHAALHTMSTDRSPLVREHAEWARAQKKPDPPGPTND